MANLAPTYLTVQPSLYIGLMSGTSMDAVDTAIVEFNPGSSLTYYAQYPIEDDLRQKLRPASQHSTLEEIAQLDFILGHRFADAVKQALQDANLSASDIVAIGSHGQTVFHHPNRDWHTSMQLGDPNIIAAETGITTVADFRRMDMALGGQGAPLAPAFHRFQFRHEKTNRTVVNIGGIANITTLPAGSNQQITGFDTGPGNGLLDDWNYKHQQTAMDEDSRWAGSGKVIPGLLEKMKNDPYFSLAPPKSTGREYFNLDWLGRLLVEQNEPAPEDVQATLLELSMTTIADAIQSTLPDCEEVYLCGGGARNTAMRARLGELLDEMSVDSTQAIGIDPDAVEAITFAWLAYCRVNNLEIALEMITGAKQRQLPGGIYKAANNPGS